MASPLLAVARVPSRPEGRGRRSAERSYKSIPDLKAAVDHALTTMEATLIDKCQPQLRLAA